MQTISELPEEIKLLIFHFMNAADLNVCSRVCKEWRALQNASQAAFIWYTVAKSYCKEMIVDKSLGRDISVAQWLKITKYLHESKNLFSTEDEAPFRHTLISEALNASSVDHRAQSLKETRNASKFHRTFWSSTGSETEDGNEYGTFRLFNPEYVQQREELLAKAKHEAITSEGIAIYLIDKILIRVFQASWQGHNVYACKKLKLSIGIDEKEPELFTTIEYPIAHAADLQTIQVGPIALITKHIPSREMEVESTPQPELAQQPESIEDEDDDDEIVDTELEITNDELADALVMFNGQVHVKFLEYLRDRVHARKKEEKEMQEREAALRTIHIPKNGDLFAKIDFIGKTTTQPTDNLYYTCIETLDVTGDARVIA